LRFPRNSTIHRHAEEYLYKDEFESYVKEGVLTMHTAFSREQARLSGLGVPSTVACDGRLEREIHFGLSEIEYTPKWN
jgi:hypothetical protein